MAYIIKQHPRRLGQIRTDMTKLWDMPDQDEAKVEAAKLLAETLESLSRQDIMPYILREAIEGLLWDYSQLISGIRYED